LQINGGSGGGTTPSLHLTFAGSILQLRGDDPVSPPLKDPNSGSILLWNGEIFNENNEKQNLTVPTGGNDAEALLDALLTTNDIPSVFSSIHGPWACVFWHSETGTLWFGRDVLGRRSLLVKWPQAENFKKNNSTADGDGKDGSIGDGLLGGSNSFILTSVVPLDPDKSTEGYTEVEPGLYKIKLIDFQLAEKNTGSNGNEDSTSSSLSRSPTIQNDAVESSVPSIEERFANFQLDKLRETAVDWQNEDIKAIKVFHRPENLIEPPLEDDLDNENDEEKGVKRKDREEKGEAITVEGNTVVKGKKSTHATAVDAAVKGVLDALRDAVRVRCHCIDTPRAAATSSSFSPFFSQDKEAGQPEITPARLMILFSGGVDSTLLSALAHEYLPPDEPIDLVSICFAQGTSPDREAALHAFEELKLIAPDRPWRLLGADKILEDVENARDRLLKLLYPSDTVMDLNIGAALWLAAAGEGKILRLGNNNNSGAVVLGEVGMSYRSTARCVFLGHGADELFGGYGRHRTRFRNAGWQGLSEELALDVKRLWVRNLGRDDRLVADQGREARHPFLDERVILQALQYHPLCALTDLRMELGVGDKLVLREILRKLGLRDVAGRVKRAIQFGTRLAKVTNAAQFGGTRQANAKNAGSVRLSEVPKAVGRS
jgi:asparagine synthetase B (glutamine-hydrolysing)